MLPTKVAKILKDLYSKKFWSKPKGKYQITKEHLIQLTGQKTIDDSQINNIKHKLEQLGFVIIDIGASFAIIEMKILSGFRKVPKRIIEEYIEKSEEKRKKSRKKIKKKGNKKTKKSRYS